MFAYHATTSDRLDSIKLKGLIPGYANRIYFCHDIETCINFFREKSEAENLIFLRVSFSKLKLKYDVSRIKQMLEFYVEHQIPAKDIQIKNNEKWHDICLF